LIRTDLEAGYEVTVESAEGTTGSYRVETTPAGGRRYLNATCCSTEREVFVHPDGHYEATLADGTRLVATANPDPRWGMHAPLIDPLQVTTPGGLQATVRETASAVLDDPADVFSLSSLTTGYELNGLVYTIAYDGTTGMLTRTSPGGRRTFAGLDGQGRWDSLQLEGLEALRFARDTGGLLTTIEQGTGTAARTIDADYDVLGRITGVTDPAGGALELRLGSGRAHHGHHLPHGRRVGYGHDANGNIVSLAPPGRPAHGFAYTAVDLEAEYTPPPVDGAATTQYAYDRDRRLVGVLRPDGAAVDLTYDGQGRLSAIAAGGVSLSYAYDTAGRVASATAFDGGTLGCTYDGFVRTGVRGRGRWRETSI